MSKHSKSHEAVNEEVSAVSEEQPKVKVGDQVATTTVDKPAKEKKDRAPRVPKDSTYRVLDGVDATKFSGQAGLVLKSLQKLDATNPGASWPIADVISNLEGTYPAKVPVEASVLYHLRDQAKKGAVEATPVAPATPAVATQAA